MFFVLFRTSSAWLGDFRINWVLQSFFPAVLGDTVIACERMLITMLLQQSYNLRDAELAAALKTFCVIIVPESVAMLPVSWGRGFWGAVTGVWEYEDRAADLMYLQRIAYSGKRFLFGQED